MKLNYYERPQTEELNCQLQAMIAASDNVDAEISNPFVGGYEVEW